MLTIYDKTLTQAVQVGYYSEMLLIDAKSKILSFDEEHENVHVYIDIENKKEDKGIIWYNSLSEKDTPILRPLSFSVGMKVLRCTFLTPGEPMGKWV